MEHEIIFPENEVPPTDTSPVKLTAVTAFPGMKSIPSPDTLLAKAELKAKELARLRQLLMRQKRQQLRKVSKQNLKSKNQRRKAIAARSRKRNR